MLKNLTKPHFGCSDAALCAIMRCGMFLFLLRQKLSETAMWAIGRCAAVVSWVAMTKESGATPEMLHRFLPSVFVSLTDYFFTFLIL